MKPLQGQLLAMGSQKPEKATDSQPPCPFSLQVYPSFLDISSPSSFNSSFSENICFCSDSVEHM